MSEDFSSSTVAGEQLLAIVERVERLEEEKQDIQEGIKEVYAEAKANGFDTKIVRQIVKLRRKPAEERDEEFTLLELYMNAIGMTINE